MQINDIESEGGGESVGSPKDMMQKHEDVRWIQLPGMYLIPFWSQVKSDAGDQEERRRGIRVIVSNSSSFIRESGSNDPISRRREERSQQAKYRANSTPASKRRGIFE